MSNSSPGARAVSVYEIDDVFLVESHCWVLREFNQTEQMPDLIYAQQSRIDKDCLIQQRIPVTGEDPIFILRYFIKAELRFLKPGVQIEGRELLDEDIFSLLRFTIAADYRCPKDALEDRDAISAFGRNAYFHAWPYLREEVHAACSKLRIPRITLPMLKLDKDGMIKAKTIHESKSKEQT